MSIFFQFAAISVARSKGALVGRRALAGIILSMTPWGRRCVVLMVFRFFFSFSSFYNYRRCPQTWPSRPRSHRFNSLCTHHCHVPGRPEHSVIPLKRNFPQPSIFTTSLLATILTILHPSVLMTQFLRSLGR